MGTLDQFIILNALGAGRRAVAFRMLRNAADARGLQDLVARADAAMAENDRATALQMEWERQKAALRAPREATAADRALDRAMAGLHAVLSAWADHELPGMPAEEARRVRSELFPGGLQEATQVDHATQAVGLQAGLDALKKPEAAADVEKLRLGPALEELEALTRHMLAAMQHDRGRSRPLTWEEVVAADQASLSRLRELVARVLGAFPTDEPADVEARAALLEGVLRQCEEFREAFRRRRRRKKPAADAPAAAPAVPRKDAAPPRKGVHTRRRRRRTR